MAALTPRDHGPFGLGSPQHLRDEPRTITIRQVLTPALRYRRAGLLTLLGSLAMVGTAAVLATPTYEAEMKVLVKRERLDPMVSAGVGTAPVERVQVSEADLYGEVELLNGQELLAQVLRTGSAAANSQTVGEPDTARQLDELRDNLTIEPIRRTNMIRVAYRAPDSGEATSLLHRLSSLYLEKHLAVHRPAGAKEFFDEQVDRYGREVHEAEQRLREFASREDVVSAAQQKEDALAKVSQFESELQQTLAAVADASRRRQSIARELQGTPDRQVTAVRDSANVDTIRGLRAHVLQLEIKRQDLLQKFTPTYFSVVALDQELGQLKVALAAAEQQPLRDETTDQNPTHQWLRNEAVRVETERRALTARAAAIRRTVTEYGDRARRFDAIAFEQQELQRVAKVAQDSFVLYQQKQEEMRIGAALDRTRVANVAIAEAPWVSSRPTSSRAAILAGGGAASLLLSMGVVGVLYRLNPYFRTADEVRAVMAVPVLAALPAPARE